MEDGVNGQILQGDMNYRINKQRQEGLYLFIYF